MSTKKNKKIKYITETIRKTRNFKNVSIRLLTYFKPHKYKFMLVFLLAILSTLFSITAPKIMGHVTNILTDGVKMKVIEGKNYNINFFAIKELLFILVVLYIFSSIFSYFEKFIMATVSQNVVLTLRKEIIEKLSILPLKYFDENSKGDILSRVTNDIDNISNTLEQTLTEVITVLVTLLGITLMMLSINVLMTIILLIIIPIGILIIKTAIRYSQKFFFSHQKEVGALNGHIEEVYTAHNIVKLFNQEESSLEEFKKINNRLFKAGWKSEFLSNLIDPFIAFINNIGYVIIFVLGGFLVTMKIINIGDIQAFTQYLKNFTKDINETSTIINTIQTTIASTARVFEILDEEENPINFKKKKILNNIKGDVLFNHVSFGYKEDNLLLKNINLHVNPGESLAIVGATGSGKSTLINLLIGFYSVNEGSITLDNVNIENILTKNLRNSFGIILQDCWLFNGTIKENISYCKENVTDDEIIAAAKAARAHHFIKTLPNGYDTVLNEDSSNISQGQKQLLAIARIILANPSILILDEAASNVDTRTEFYIQKSLRKLANKKTTFLIAHRLSTINDADSIIVLNHGKIIEKGNHESLMRKNGLYAELYKSQFSNYYIKNLKTN